MTKFEIGDRVLMFSLYSSATLTGTVIKVATDYEEIGIKVDTEAAWHWWQNENVIHLVEANNVLKALLDKIL